jgi:hypothetical protein
MVRENLRIAQSRQKRYTKPSRREFSFEIGDFVYLKVSPMRGSTMFKGTRQAHDKDHWPFKITEERKEELKAEFLNPSES